MKRLQHFLLLVVLLLNNSNSFAQRSNCTQALQQISTDSLMQHLQELVGKKIVYVNDSHQYISSRYAFHKDNGLAASYLAQKCASYGFSIRKMNYSGTGMNILAEKTGTQFPNKSIMLCAHYDCVGGTFTKFQGADDNASGCAAIIEAARVLKNINFPYTIQLAFWDEEEIGLLGSKAHPLAGGGLPEIITAINLDMIAWDDNKDNLAMLHASSALPISIDFANRLQYLIGKYKLPLISTMKIPGEPNTDHQALWDKGIPAIGLTEDYDNDFSPNWHRYSDSIDNIHIPYFVAMSKLAVMGLCEFAQEGGTGLNVTNSGSSLVRIYPNPITKQICFSELNQVKTIEINNSLGQLISTTEVNTLTNLCMPAPDLVGFYVVSIFGSNQEMVRIKIIVE
jgi:hypothetical protein